MKDTFLHKQKGLSIIKRKTAFESEVSDFLETNNEWAPMLVILNESIVNRSIEADKFSAITK